MRPRATASRPVRARNNSNRYYLFNGRPRGRFSGERIIRCARGREEEREKDRERVGQRGVQFRSRANDNFNARIHHEGGHGIRTASWKSRELASNGINLANSDAA